MLIIINLKKMTKIFLNLVDISRTYIIYIHKVVKSFVIKYEAFYLYFGK